MRQLDADDRERALDHPADHAEPHTEDARKGGLRQELPEDRSSSSPHRLADADLAGAWVHGDEHDVRDPDPTDQEAERRATTARSTVNVDVVSWSWSGARLIQV